MAELSDMHRKYGPDASLVGIADWLSEHHATIDKAFHDNVGLFAIRLVEVLTREHDEVEHELDTPLFSVRFEDWTGETVHEAADQSPFLEGSAGKARLSFNLVRAAIGDNGDVIRKCYVADTDVHFHEVLWLTLLRSGDVVGALRYHALNSDDRNFDILEQFFRWSRRDDRYVGEQIELRLRGIYVPHFLATEAETQNRLRQFPEMIYSSRETLPLKENAYRALFQMSRNPARIQFGPDFVSVIYLGEADRLRGLPESGGA